MFNGLLLEDIHRLYESEIYPSVDRARQVAEALISHYDHVEISCSKIRHLRNKFVFRVATSPPRRGCIRYYS